MANSVGVGFCAALLVLSRFIVRDWRVGTIAVMVLVEYQEFFGRLGGLRLGLGVTIYPMDILTVLFLFTALTKRRFGRDGLYWWALLVLLGVSLLRGIGPYGLTTAADFVRPSLYLISAVLYARSLFEVGTGIESLARILRANVLAVAAYAVLFWAQHGFHASNVQIVVNGELTDSRALSAPVALLVAQAALIDLFMKRQNVRVPAIPLLVALVTVALSMQRTVWLSTIAGLAVVLASTRGGRSVLPKLVMGVAICAAVVMLALPAGEPLRQSFYGSTSNAFATQGTTFADRVGSWSALLTGPRPLIDWILGAPSGKGFSRTVDARLISYSPHNYYVELILLVGAAGLLAYVAYMARILFAMRRHNFSALGGALAVSVLVFCGAYRPSEVEGIVLGTALLLTSYEASRAGAKDRAPIDPSAATD